MPPKKAAKKSPAKAASSPSSTSQRSPSQSPSGKRKRPKKGPKEEKSKKILEMRDELITQGKDAERVGQACMGMYRCDKQKDEKCLDGIMDKLNVIKMGGAARRRRSKSRSAPKKK